MTTVKIPSVFFTSNDTILNIFNKKPDDLRNTTNITSENSEQALKKQLNALCEHLCRENT
jgi:hypothetical protein